MGQQPNIELEISDLPRPHPKPDSAPGWVPGRPGELAGPDDMKWGNGFGTIGPDSGYALSLVARRVFELADGEHRGNANAAIAAVAAARSSRFGRAPTKQDVDLALVLLGYDAEGVAADLTNSLAQNRLEWFAGAGHHPAKLTAFISTVDSDVLELTAAEARARLARGEPLITH